MSEEKRCPKCKQLLDLSNFYPSKQRKSGYRSYCKDCEKIDKQKYYQENKQKYYQHYLEFLDRNPRYQYNYYHTRKETQATNTQA